MYETRKVTHTSKTDNGALSSLPGAIDFKPDFIASYNPVTLDENVYGIMYQSDLNHVKELKPDFTKVGEKNNMSKKSTKKNYLKSELLEKNEKKKYFLRSLRSYIQVCGSAAMVDHAHECFLYYRYKNENSKKYNGPMDVEIYNSLLNCWSELGNLEKIRDIFIYMADDQVRPNLQSYVAYLECLSRSQNENPSYVIDQVRKVSTILEKNGKQLCNIFQECKFTGDQLKKIVEILQPNLQAIPNSDPYICHVPYTCELLNKLNDKEYEKSEMSAFINSCISRKDIMDITATQMKLESDYFLKVKSVNIRSSVNEKVLHMRKCVKEYEETFKKDMLHALDIKLMNMWSDIKGQKCMTLYPYLSVLNKETYISLLLQEIRNLADSAEYFSPNMKVMCKMMGHKVMNYYFIWLRERNKVTDKISFINSKYIEYLLTPELTANYTPREYWSFLKRLYFHGPTIDVIDVSWPHHVIYEVGKFLYEILLETASFDVNKLRPNAKTKLMVRPFYITYERCKKLSIDQSNVKSSLQMRAHPKICKLYREAELEHIEFDVSMIPMVCPPRPWTKLDAGGLLMTTIPLIRLPLHAHHQNDFYNELPDQQLYPCFDSLNSLSLCPWIINKPVLDEIIEVFRNGGCEELDVPINPEVFSNVPKIKQSMSDEEKKKLRRERAVLKKKKLEATSLWFDCLYKLSIANHFRDKIFWFPHNLDFRGRVYPTPPHFNHLGSDMVRSILLFAEGRPLGENGLNWLKIHLINLTGFKKREPNCERLKYANEILDNILDSADKPFSGHQWWKQSDEPWQTLACCKEIANAVRSPDPVKYLSHFPVHQDGSCNGLQHYAALGRDKLGAKEVNLFPASCPQDVYTGVATLVENERQKDAACGHEIARALDGFVKRKVVKQTIMTFVYGVTEYGAKQQILKQLNASDFPDEMCNPAARYLMKQTFSSIQKMFTATREIQKWFTDSAELITRISEEPVEWVTPLGLPVIQPYHRKATVRSLTDFISKGRSGYGMPRDSTASSYESTFEIYQLPNVRKQKNAFAPNFIHSLDSSHMMLTSLFCQRKGITFVSVHDCYWTHPSTVEIMNQVCREQFVSLHSQPILEDLSQFFLQKYVGKKSSTSNENATKQLGKLKAVLSKVPKKGSFNLEYVLDSVYFFS